MKCQFILKSHSLRNQNFEGDSFGSSISCTRSEIPSCSVNQVASPFQNYDDDSDVAIFYVVAHCLKHDSVVPWTVSAELAPSPQFCPFFARFLEIVSFATN